MCVCVCVCVSLARSLARSLAGTRSLAFSDSLSLSLSVAETRESERAREREWEKLVGTVLIAILSFFTDCLIHCRWATNRLELMTFLHQATRTAAGLAKSAVEETGLLEQAKKALQRGGSNSYGPSSGDRSKTEGALSASDEVLQATAKRVEELQARVVLLESQVTALARA